MMSCFASIKETDICPLCRKHHQLTVAIMNTWLILQQQSLCIVLQPIKVNGKKQQYAQDKVISPLQCLEVNSENLSVL